MTLLENLARFIYLLLLLSEHMHVHVIILELVSLPRSSLVRTDDDREDGQHSHGHSALLADRGGEDCVQ